MVHQCAWLVVDILGRHSVRRSFAVVLLQASEGSNHTPSPIESVFELHCKTVTWMEVRQPCAPLLPLAGTVSDGTLLIRYLCFSLNTTSLLEYTPSDDLTITCRTWRRAYCLTAKHTPGQPSRLHLHAYIHSSLIHISQFAFKPS